MMLSALHKKLFSNYWSPLTSLALAGIFSALYFGLTGTVWAVTGEFTRLSGHFMHLIGIDTSDWAYFQQIKMKGSSLTRTDGWIVWGMFAGALIGVLFSNNFKIRLPQQKRRWIQGIAGGIIAGFGARLAMGCNLAAFFTGVPQFSLHSWIFIVATGIGAWFGTRLIKLPWWRGKRKLIKGHMVEATVKNTRLQPRIGALVTLLSVILIVYLFASGKHMLGIAAIFGLIFGLLIERGQICFTSAFRDLWLLRRGKMAKAIVIGMLVSSVITFAFIIWGGVSPITQIAAPSTFVGGVLFGLGIVLASGCETGMMYRLMEGQLLYLPVFLGNLAGAGLLAYSWDHLGVQSTLAASGEKINLIMTLGPSLAIIATLLMLTLLYVLVIMYEKGGQSGHSSPAPMRTQYVH